MLLFAWKRSVIILGLGNLVGSTLASQESLWLQWCDSNKEGGRNKRRGLNFDITEKMNDLVSCGASKGKKRLPSECVAKPFGILTFSHNNNAITNPLTLSPNTKTCNLKRCSFLYPWRANYWTCISYVAFRREAKESDTPTVKNLRPTETRKIWRVDVPLMCCLESFSDNC